MTAGHGAGQGGAGAVAQELADTVRRLRQDADRLRAGERDRAAVDVATGILAERLRCTPAEAAARLARLAREAGQPVAVLAADLAGAPEAVRLSAPQTSPEAVKPPEPGEPPGGSGGPAGPGPLLAAPALAAVPDLQRAAEAVLDQSAGPLGARAVVLWQRLPGGALALAGHAGLTTAEAQPWSRVPPGVDTPAQYVVHTGRELWPTGRRRSAVSVGGPAADRAVLPLVDAGRRRGALELLWPGPAPALTQSLRRQLYALADLCATLLDTSDPPDPPGPPAPDPAGALLDGLLTPALLLEPLLRDGRLADFRIARTNARFRDPLDRPRAALEGASLLETYPDACAAGLYDLLADAHTTGEPRPGERLHLVFRRGDARCPPPSGSPSPRWTDGCWSAGSSPPNGTARASRPGCCARPNGSPGSAGSRNPRRPAGSSGTTASPNSTGCRPRPRPSRWPASPTTPTRTTSPPSAACWTPSSGATAPPSRSSGWSGPTAPSATPGSSPSPSSTTRAG